MKRTKQKGLEDAGNYDKLVEIMTSSEPCQTFNMEQSR